MSEFNLVHIFQWLNYVIEIDLVLVLVFRVLKSEVEELEELEKERDRFYELKICEMKEFKENVEKFVVECQMRVEELRNTVKEVMSKAVKLQLH